MVRPTKASAAVASTVEGITPGCVGEVNMAALGAAMRAANLDDMQGPVSPAEAANRWWADYPAIATEVIGLQQKWMARVVPLVGAGTANVTRVEVGAAVTQFQSEVEADCRSMASRNLGGTSAVPVAPAPSTPEPVTSTPVAVAPDSPLANVDWSSVRYGLDCSVPGMGIEITGKDFFDVTGDGVKDALVRVACRVGTGPSPDPVYVFDGGSAPLAPRLLGTLVPKMGSAPYEIKTVTAIGPAVTLSGLEWSSRAGNCCGDINWTQTYIWSAGKFQVDAIKRDRIACSDRVSAAPNTSCAFALVVDTAWRQVNGWNVNEGVTVDINAHSPTTNTSYAMRCTKGMPTVCRGGNDATVYIQN